MSAAVVRLKINDQVVEAREGMNLIEAAKLIGVEIPHLCYHPALCIAGNCRLCVVEVATLRTGPTGSPLLEWNPKLTIACNTTVVEGMEVRTHTPRVLEARRGVMEFLLINHPLDCPICDQAGECRLQELAVDVGRGESRFTEQKEHKPKRTPLGTKIVLDDERCILCARCIRFMRDVVKQDRLGFTGRGSRSVLTCYPGQAPDSNYDLNLVDLCPVGALTSADFRFTQRVWFLRQTRSICPSCSRGCNITIGSREGRVYRLVPRDNEAVNHCWMCDTGRLGYTAIHDASRMTAAVSRRNGQACAVPREELLHEIAGHLQSLRETQAGVAIITSSCLTTEELYLVRRLSQRLDDAITEVIPHTGPADTWLMQADRTPNLAGCRAVGLIHAEPGSRVPEIGREIAEGHLRALVVLGEDVVEHGIQAAWLEKLELLVVLDSRQTRTASLAHYAIPGASFAEKEGTFINSEGRIQRLSSAIASPGEAQPELSSLSVLLRALGERVPQGAAAVYGEMAHSMTPFWGITWEAIGSQGVRLHGS